MANNCWNGIRPGRTVARDGSAHDDGHVCRFSAATDDAIRRPSVTGLWLSFRRTGPHWTVASLRTLSGAAYIIARFAGFRAFLVGFTNQAQYGLFNVAEPFLMVRHLQVFVGGMYVHTRCVNIVRMGLLFDLINRCRLRISKFRPGPFVSITLPHVTTHRNHGTRRILRAVPTAVAARTI
jgi:hypothetical protein